jgi:hypothetical protein
MGGTLAVIETRREPAGSCGPGQDAVPRRAKNRRGTPVAGTTGSVALRGAHFFPSGWAGPRR